MLEYLTNIPQEVEKYGFCKTLLVRSETINIKHIFTEIFVRKTIDIQPQLDILKMNLFDYMEYMTNRLRKIYRFDRSYEQDLNKIVKYSRKDFFPTLELYQGLNNLIILDFDGVITKKSFIELYKLCIARCKVEICSANPQITLDYFIKRDLPLPTKINACKGKSKKLRKIIEISKKYDYVFYVDNEEEYLETAWLFGIQTFIYKNKQIKHFSLNSK